MKKLILEDIVKQNHSDIIIYGAGVYGEIAYRGLEYLGIKPKFFSDRYMAGKTYFNITIINPNELKNHKNSTILIASAPYFSEIRTFLDDIGCTNYYDIEELMRLPIPESKLSNKAKEKVDNIELYSEAMQYSSRENEFILGHLELVVTEKCSLKCKDCANLMQYYKHPEDINIDQYKESIDRLIKCSDRISELRILGGEPFISKDINKIIEWYGDNEKIGKIVIYTNGTIIPDIDTLNSLENKNVVIHISDYSVKTSKTERLVKEFTNRNIRYFIRKYDSWNQLGNLVKRSYCSEKMEDIFKNCVMANCYSFYKGKLYRCPRSAHGSTLGAFKDVSRDYVDMSDKTITDEAIKLKCIELINRKESLEACKYCDGSNWHEESVTPALQISRPLEFDS